MLTNLAVYAFIGRGLDKSLKIEDEAFLNPYKP
jgi:hypothetical protein